MSIINHGLIFVRLFSSSCVLPLLSVLLGNIAMVQYHKLVCSTELFHVWNIIFTNTLFISANSLASYSYFGSLTRVVTMLRKSPRYHAVLLLFKLFFLHVVPLVLCENGVNDTLVSKRHESDVRKGEISIRDIYEIHALHYSHVGIYGSRMCVDFWRQV